MYYLSYGSNQNSDQMKLRCPNAKKIGNTTLNDIQLVFIGETKNKGYASLAMKEGAQTPITIYELSENDMQALDHFEGVSKYIYRKENWRIRFEGQRIEGIVYLRTSGAYQMPSDEYLEQITKGYHDQGFELKTIYFALDLSDRLEGQSCPNKI